VKEDRKGIEDDRNRDADKDDWPIDVHGLTANRLEVKPESHTK